MPSSTDENQPQDIAVAIDAERIEKLLGQEWLLTNPMGTYASSSVVGCNTRRYHGLLVAATTPPTGRRVTLATVMEQFTPAGQPDAVDLATNEFPGVFSPRGYEHLAEFHTEPCPTTIYRIGEAELTRQIILADSTHAVAVRYTLRGGSGNLRVWPFAAMRDFHHLRKVHAPHQVTYEPVGEGIVVEDRRQGSRRLYITSPDASFSAKSQWWYQFTYRVDIGRGQDGHEDLYTPGYFEYELSDGQSVQLSASIDAPHSVDFDSAVQARQRRRAACIAGLGDGADELTVSLAAASDDFVVQRAFPGEADSTTIVAGYHWFADWGRDAFIALPGLLLATGRYEQARGVFRTFVRHLSEGMVPNRFDDYSTSAHYNSIDASLWFILAAERFLRASGDETFWRNELLPACQQILQHFHDGTRFDIHADGDGLLTGGSQHTQLTWMDAAMGDEVVTPRQGKAVEINALWYAAHCILADRLAGHDDAAAEHYRHAADLLGPAFAETFWYGDGGYLYDCVCGDQRDASLRPNQIFAVALPYSPLDGVRQRSVVRVVREHLLTSRGLRTLSPFDPRYRRKYGGSWQSRDRAYHQGTVWAWPIGAFIEAYLRTEEFSDDARRQAENWVSGFDSHLLEAGLGTVSEIFDGDEPHMARGCIAQAWSVGELLRAKRLIAVGEERKA